MTVSQRLHSAFSKAGHTPDVRSRFEQGGYEVVGNQPEEFAAMLKKDIEATAEALRPLGIRLEQ